MMPLPNFYLVLRVQLVSTLNFQGESRMSNKKKLVELSVSQTAAHNWNFK